MRLPNIDEHQLRERLEKERVNFAKLDKQKTDMWNANMDIQEYERVKVAWKDSAEEITHLHKQLHPYFPYSGTCSNCGGDKLPLLGANSAPMYSCVVCEQVDIG